MLTLVLIRPGETDYDRHGRVQGRLDVPLNDEGMRQVEQMVAELQPLDIELIYSPEHEPAWQTAQRLSTALELKLKSIDHLENLDYGLWQGTLVDEIRRKQPKVYRQWQEQPECVCPPEGETLADAQERVQAALARLFKKHKQGRVAVVVPEPLASLVRVQLGHCELGDLWRAGAERPRWELIEPKVPSAAR